MDAINKRTLKNESQIQMEYIYQNTPYAGNSEYWGFKKRRLGGVAQPINENDAVTLNYLRSNTIQKDNDDTWNADNKRITNTKAPENPSDVVNLGYFRQNTPKKDETVTHKYLESKSIILNDTNEFWQANNKLIRNVSDPEQDKDVVNKKYLQTNTIQKTNDDDEDWDAGRKRITNVQDPKHFADAVTLRYYSLNTPKRGTTFAYDEKNKVWSGANKRIQNVANPVEANDVVTKDYIQKVGFIQYFDGWDAKSARIKDVANPVNGKDAVNKDTLFNSTITTRGAGNDWNAKDMRIKNLADPLNSSDAINGNYLTRVLCELAYNIQRRLAPSTDSVFRQNKNLWLKTNIVDPLFVNARTKVLRTASDGSEEEAEQFVVELNLLPAPHILRYNP